MPDQTKKLSKLENLLLHVIRRVENPFHLGAVKLQKIVWFSDGEMVLRTGHGISDADFRRRPQGPHSRDIEQALAHLKEHGLVAERRETPSWGTFEQRLFFAMGAPDLSDFSADEIAVVDQMIDVIAYGHTARSISDVTHDKLWETLADGDAFPPSTILAWHLGTPASEDAVAWAEEAAKGLAPAAIVGPSV